MSIGLPRAAAVTDELLAPAPGLSADDVGALRLRLTVALAPLAAELPSGERLMLDGFRYGTALRRPELCGRGDEPFAPSPRTCRRAIGLAAVERCLRRRSPGPAHAVAGVLGEGVDDAGRSESTGAPPAPWWARWYAGLGAGARAMVAAEATTWATELWTALQWDRLPHPVVLGGRDDWWDLPGRRLTLRGRVELRVPVDGRAALLMVRGGAPDAGSRAELAFCALVAALSAPAGRLPGRVLGLWPAAGALRVLPVSARSLEVAGEEVVGAVGTWVDACIERCRDRPPRSAEPRAGTVCG